MMLLQSIILYLYDIILITTVLLLVLVVFLYYYFTKTFNHWKDKGVPYEKPIPFFGNVKDIILTRINTAQGIQRLYMKFPNERFVGIFQSRKPVLLIRDPDLIKHVLVKDFNHFINRGIVNNKALDPLSENLFNIGGQKWKDLRQKLTPTFTSGKLKSMFQSLAECGDDFNLHLKDTVLKHNVFEMSDISGNYTTQVIGSCVFGININSIKDPDSEFRRMGKKIFDPTVKGFIKRMIRTILPAVYSFFNMRTISSIVEQFFLTVVKDMVRQRKENNITRADFLQLLIELKEKEERGENQENQLNFKMDDNLLAAQMFVFFIAGFETSSTTMSFCLYELALNEDIQERAQLEIDKVLEKYEGKLTYEAVLEMEYLDNVVSETLRKHSPAGNLVRKCEIPYQIPGSDVTLKKDDSIMIPVHALHHDAQYFPNPDKFDPDRFSKENDLSTTKYCYLPFGEGPRICIGLRFAKFQTLVGLISILRDFTVSPCEKTEIPLVYSGKSLILRSKSGIYLQMKNRTA